MSIRNLQNMVVETEEVLFEAKKYAQNGLIVSSDYEKFIAIFIVERKRAVRMYRNKQDSAIMTLKRLNVMGKILLYDMLKQCQRIDIALTVKPEHHLDGVKAYYVTSV